MQNRPLPLPHLPPQKKRRRPFSSSSFWLSQRGGGGEKVITTLPPLLLPPPPRSSSVEAEGGTEFIALIFRRMGEMSGLLSIPLLIRLFSLPCLGDLVQQGDPARARRVQGPAHLLGRALKRQRRGGQGHHAGQCGDQNKCFYSLKTPQLYICSAAYKI